MHTKFYKTIIWLVFLAMIGGFGLPALFKKTSRFSWVMRINSETIEYPQFMRRVEAKQAQLELMRYQFEQMGIPFDVNMLRINPQQWAFNSLIEDALLDRVAEPMQISLDEEYVAFKLSDPYYMIQELSEFIPPYVVMSSRELNSETINKLLRNKGLSIADFEQFVEQNLKRKCVKDIVAISAYVPKFAVKDAFVQNYLGKKFSIVTFSLHEVIKKEKIKHATPQEVQIFFDEENKKSKRYFIPEKRSGYVWEFNPDFYGISIHDEEIKAYYDANKSKYLEKPAQIKVRHIVFAVKDPSAINSVKEQAETVRAELVKSPQSFGRKAEEVSQDPSAKKGGMIDYIARNDIKDEAFARAAFALKENNEISPVIQTSRGFEIIQRVDRKSAEYKKLHAVHHEIKEHLLHQTFKQKFDKDMERIEHALDKKDVLIHEKHAHEKIIKHAELDDKLAHQRLFKIKNKGELGFYKDKNRGYLVQLTDIQKSYMPELKHVHDRMLHDLHTKLGKKALAAELEEAKKEASSKPLHDIARKYDAHVRTTDWIKRDNTKAVEQLSKENLPVAQMLQMENKSMMLTHMSGEHGYLIRLDALESVDDKNFESKKSEIYSDLAQRNSGLVVAGFIASLNRDATIEVNEKALENN